MLFSAKIKSNDSKVLLAKYGSLFSAKIKSNDSKVLLAKYRDENPDLRELYQNKLDNPGAVGEETFKIETVMKNVSQSFT